MIFNSCKLVADSCYKWPCYVDNSGFDDDAQRLPHEVHGILIPS